jgi:parallel beta-helix repeat protein
MNAKNGLMVLSLLFVCMFAHVAFVEPVSAATVDVQNASYYSNGTLSLSEQIQSILDNAASGDTIKFLGNVYENLQLVINKKLNIVTSGTKISGSNSSGSAVFLINGSQASGTQISGFTIDANAGSGIILNNTRSVTLSNDQISSTKGSAVTVNKSSSTVIKNSNITDSNTGVTISNSNNTKITGSTIKNNTEDGVDVENSVNTTLSQDQILNNAKRGVNVYNSKNTTIASSTIKGNGNNSNAGLSSDEGGVYVKSSSGVKITKSKITDNSQGVSVVDASNVIINSNTIVGNYGEGILLSGSVNGITVTSNYIDGNNNGIMVNYYTGNHVNISGNFVTGSVDRIKNEDSGNGMSFGSGYCVRSVTEVIEHNVIVDNGNFEMRARDASTTPKIGSNWYSGRLCPALEYAASMQLELERTGTNSYTVSFLDGVTGELVTDLYPTLVTLTADGYSQTGTTQNGKVTFTVSYDHLTGMITATAYGVSVSIPWNSQKTNSGNTDNGNSGSVPSSGSGITGNGPGSGSGSGSGSASSSGSSSGTSGSLSSTTGVMAASAAAGQAGSNGEGDSKSKTAQELFIDNAVKNSHVWGIVGIIVLIVLVLMAYYRKDLMSMIKKSRK